VWRRGSGRTAREDTFFTLPDIVVPSAAAYTISVVCMFLGGIQLARGFGKRTNMVLGVVALLFVHVPRVGPGRR
jgi:hypothetical protein